LIIKKGFTLQGKIIKGIAGFYYVSTPTGLYECRAKGIFRKENKKPLVGDDVEVDIINEESKEGNVIQLLPRKSSTIRPAAANVDQVLAVLAVKDPYPSFQLLDRLLILCRQQNLPCIICLNKQDLDDASACQEFVQTYEKCGSPILVTSTKTINTTEANNEFDILSTQASFSSSEALPSQALDADCGKPSSQVLSADCGKPSSQALTADGEILRSLLAGKTTAIAGPSGVGKSSLINCLQSGIVMETGLISDKIRRGKHTTRHTQLIPIPDLQDSQGNHTYILDTPGFSSLDILPTPKEDLASFYPEFTSFEPNCRFQGCSHVTEPDCAVRTAVSDGQIAKRRYDNYTLLYKACKNRSHY
jgi:ribosome biogenesis GTPase